MEELYKSVYIKYKNFIKNDLLYFEDLTLNLIDKKRENDNTIESYFDCTIPEEYEMAVLKIKENSDIYRNNKIDILDIKNSKYLVGFLYPSEYMEKENTYNFKKFWIYTDENKKKELRLSSFTIISDIIVKKNNKNNKINIKFDKNNFNEIEDIIIIKIKDLMDHY